MVTLCRRLGELLNLVGSILSPGNDNAFIKHLLGLLEGFIEIV